MKPIEVGDFPYGLMTKLSPTEMPNGSALLSYDCDYNTRNVAVRRGFQAVLENGPGAVKIANMEASEDWRDASNGPIFGDTADGHFIPTEAEAAGVQSIPISAVGGGAAGVASLVLSPAKDLGVELLDVIHSWVRCLILPAGITAYTLTLRFETAANNYYEAVIASNTDIPNILEAGRGRYSRIRRKDFTAMGSPNWQSINKVKFTLAATGTGTMSLVVDNLHRTPGIIQDLFQFRRQSGAFAGASDYYVVAGGTLYKSDGARWQSVVSGFSAAVPVQSISTLDRRVLTDGVTTPRVLMADGVTVYRLGIVTPPRQVVATQIGGGGLPDGDYFFQVLYYSSKTGTFSAPDLRVPQTPITITGGGGTAGIRFTNLPVSSDPQVDFIVIGIRPATEPELFFRASDGLNGEVPNGTTTFDFTDNLATLLARSLTAVDPDLDYPSVIDRSTGQPVEAHPLFFAEAGGYLLTVMAEQPTVVRASRFRQPGSWALDDEFPLGENDQERISGLAVTGSFIIAMKRDAVYPGRVVGGDEKIRFDPPISDRGATSHKGMQVVGSILFYRAMDGIYTLGVDLVPVKLTDLAQPTWEESWDAYGIGLEVMIPLRDHEQVVLFGRGLGSAVNNLGWVTHYRTVQTAGPARFPSWAPSLWRVPADVAAEVLMSAPPGGGWETWIAGTGQVFRIFGYEDDGRSIEYRHRTNLMTPNPAFSHIWRFVDVEALCSGDSTLDVRCFLGTALIADASPMADLGGYAAVLGSFVLGTSRLGAQQYVPQRVNLPVRPARYLSVELHGRTRRPVEIYRLRPWYAPLGARRNAA